MAIEDINISEQFETSAPNMEIAQGGPEDFMTEDEMDPSNDPELQQLLESLPGEQAEVLMQLIKEFKAMVAQGFQGEFEDFVKMKMATAQGGPEEFMSEEEMTISPEEQQSLIPMGQQVAHGGRIGRERGGIMDVIAEEQIETGPTPQQLIMAWLEARGLPPTPENIQKAILEMSREGQGPSMPREQMQMPQMEAPRPPTGEDYVPEELIGQDQSPQGIASMGVMTEEPEILPQEKPYTEDMFSDSVDALLQGMKGAPESTEYLQNVLEEKKYEFKQNNPDFPDERIDEIIREKQFNIDNSLRDQRIKNIPPPFNLAQGGRIGYQYGGTDTTGVTSQVSDARVQQIEQARLYEEAEDKIMQKFYDTFPGIDDPQSIEHAIAELQAEGVADHATDILSFAAGLDMITPESVRKSTQKIMGGDTQHSLTGEWEEEHPFDHPVDEMRGGRPGYGLGSLVSSVFKSGKKLVKSVKKFAKSDLGKMALGYLATAGLANVGAAGGFGKASWASPFTKGTGWLRPSNVMGNLTKSYGNLFSKSPEITKASKALTGGNQYSPIANMGYNKNLSTVAKGTADKGGMFSGLLGSFKDNPMPWILGSSLGAGAYTAANPGKDNLDNLMGNYKGEVSDWDKIFADIRSGKKSTAFSTENTDYPYPNYMNLAAEGGRMGRAEGGLMNLGGLEKDYRAEGGFVPIGKKEKADDVPARLSVNEFVFTADAVRNAGGGDVDRGAEVMENVMTNLEQGGSISEESQGLEGARDMFEVSERLSEVV
jgi:hypothetical protein